MPDAMGVSMNHNNQRSAKRTTIGLLALALAFVVVITIGVTTATAGNRQQNALLQTTPIIGFSQANYEVTEGNRATITVQISPSPTVTATVDYETRDGTARAGIDYTSASGVLVFIPGATSQSFQIQTRSRSTFVGDRTVILRLSNASANAILDANSDISVLTILEDQVPTATPRTPTPIFVDRYEPNNTLDTAFPTAADASALCDITLWPTGDVDWFRFSAKAGRAYELLTSNLDPGLDTVLSLYGTTGNLISSNDDYEFGNLGSRVVFTANQDGNFFAQIVNKGGSDPANKTYCFEVNQIQGTATPTPLASTTVVPGADICEYNGAFDSACLIGAGDTFDMNFVPLWPEGPDNDFYRMWVKPGLLYTCETFNLSSVNDTNMILYDQNRNGLGGNDDKVHGDFGSEVSYFSTYTGWLFILVGPVAPPEYALSFLYTYSLRCTEIVATPTAIPFPTRPPSSGGVVPKPPTATRTPIGTSTVTPTPFSPVTVVTATPTPTPNIQVVPLPTATPIAISGREIAFNLTVYYDANLNFTPELTEGVEDVGVAIYDATTNELLAFGYTGENGTVRFSALTVSGTIRISIPFLQFDQVATGDSDVLIRVAPILN
jgi:hypothetical protein